MPLHRNYLFKVERYFYTVFVTGDNALQGNDEVFTEVVLRRNIENIVDR